MPCFFPLQAFQSFKLKKNGKASIYFSKPWYSFAKRIQVPCGRCTGCRLERSRQWAIRCEKEIQSYAKRGLSSCFITLTFDDDHLSQRSNPMSLDKRDFQLFMKRLRKSLITEYYQSKLLKYFLSKRFTRRFLLKYASKKVPKIKYYHCGEYGEKFKRPHYHAILFGVDFDDKVLHTVRNGHRLYTSEKLAKLWPFGFSSIGDANFDTAAYVARYIMKKHLGKDAWMRYCDIDWSTGEIVRQWSPEYTTMSRRSGIGKEWFDKYLRDVYTTDSIFVSHKKTKVRPPKYFDSLFELSHPSEFKTLKENRIDAAKIVASDNTPQRLAVKHNVLLSRIKFLKRNLE